MTRCVRGYFWVALWLGTLHGQSDLATLTGLVSDPAGAVAPAVAVTVRNIDTNIQHSVVTNNEGISPS